MRSFSNSVLPFAALGTALLVEVQAVRGGSLPLHLAAAGLAISAVVLARRRSPAAAATEKDEASWEFDATLRSNRVGLLRWTRGNTRPRPSPECAPLFGFPNGTVLSDENALLPAIVPSDRDWARERWTQIGLGSIVPPQVLTIRGEDGLVRTLRLDVHFPPAGAGPTAGPIEIIRDISHRQVTSRDFDEGQAYLNHLIRSIPGSVFHLERRPNGTYALQYVSEGTGAPLIPVGAEHQDRFSLLLAALDTEQRSRLLTSLTHSANTLEIWRHDAQVGTREQHRWLRFHALPSREGSLVTWRGMVVDATSEKHAEQELRLTRFAMDNAQDLVSILDAEGRRIYINESFVSFTGRNLSELHATRVWDNLPAYGEEGYKKLWAAVKEKGAMVIEIDLMHKSGNLMPIEVNCRYLVINGMEVVCTVSRDISARRLAEHERQLMEQQLRETQKLESLGVLAGGIAHDFNNLLTGILGNASLARDRLPEEHPLHGPLQQVEKAAVRAGELCQQMLAYAGKGRVVVGPVDLSTLVEEISHLLRVNIARRAALDLHLAPGLPHVQADATQIRQIVMNLVLNAAEAIDQPGGRIRLSTGTIVVSKEFIQAARVCHGMEPGECVCLEVQDNGSGMSQETLERIFEPFFTTKFTGRGLGLAAVLGIVRAHHGLLNVHSVPGQGTTFQLVISPEKRPAPVGPKSALPTKNLLRRYARVLVVDDEDSVRQVATQSLERAGCQVIAAESGDAALNYLRTAIADPHLVLLDFTMPQRDGLSVLRILRQIKPELPVIMMSGFSEEETRQRLDSLGVEGFLAKPFTLPQLRECVEHALKIHPPPPTATPPPEF